MRKLGEQWIEMIDGQEHMLKVVEQAKTVNADVCGGCHFGVCGDICHDGALHVCGYGEGKCPLDNVDWVIKDLGVLKDGRLPCPFCGEYPIINNDYNDENKKCFDVICTNKECGCSCETLFYLIKQEAIDAWNRRAR